MKPDAVAYTFHLVGSGVERAQNPQPDLAGCTPQPCLIEVHPKGGF